MIEINLLKHRLHEYQLAKEQKSGFDWDTAKEIICIVADVLELVAKDCPEKWSWFAGYLSLMAKVLRSLCSSTNHNVDHKEGAN